MNENVQLFDFHPFENLKNDGFTLNRCNYFNVKYPLLCCDLPPYPNRATHLTPTRTPTWSPRMNASHEVITNMTAQEFTTSGHIKHIESVTTVEVIYRTKLLCARNPSREL